MKKGIVKYIALSITTAVLLSCSSLSVRASEVSSEGASGETSIETTEGETLSNTETEVSDGAENVTTTTDTAVSLTEVETDAASDSGAADAETTEISESTQSTGGTETSDSTEPADASDTQDPQQDVAGNENLSSTEDEVQGASDTQSQEESPATESDSTAQSSEETEADTTSSAEVQTRKLAAATAPGISIMSYNGSTDISDPAVDSITFGGTTSDGSVYTYNDFTVTVAFSEDDSNGDPKSGLNIESDDTIAVNWTTPDGITITGYSNTVYLYLNDDPNGTVVGTAVVTANGVTITFNDNVNDLQHVKGTVTFAVRATGDPSSESGVTATVTSGSISEPITVKPGTGTGPEGFGSKGGSRDSEEADKINWQIWINRQEDTNLNENTKIVVTDFLPDTETLLDNYFISYSIRTDNGWHWAVYTVEDFEAIGGEIYI